MNADGPGLRERKKQALRQQISDVATRLFLERGFENVTIAEIADAAGVAKMTVTNYFPRKEDLVFDRHAELVSHAAQLVAERAVGESALAALKRGYFDALHREDASTGIAGVRFVELITGSSALQARLREIDEQRETALAAELAAGTGASPDDITVLVAAAELAAVHRILFRQALKLTLAGEPRESIVSRLATMAEEAFTRLVPVLGDYAVR
jgi:AcrR family transcriptional regulator